MRAGAFVGGVVVGAMALGWFLLDRPDEVEIDHPLPSATALFEAHPARSGLSRFLPSFGGAASTPTPEPRDTSSWIPARIEVVDAAGRPVAGADVETRVARMEYLIAGLDENQYDSIVAAQESNVPPDADPVEQAVVVLAHGRTGRDGVYWTRIEPAVTTDFLVSDGAGRVGATEAVRLDRVLDENGRETDPEPKVVRVVLAASAVIEGRVYDEQGRAVADATVSPVDLAPGSGLPGARFCESSRLVTDGSGAFSIRTRGVGAFDLTVEHPGFQPAREPAVQALPGRTTPVSITLSAAQVIAGVVVAPDGSPVAATVEADPIDGGGEAGATAVADPLQPGRFRLEVAPGLYRLTASAPGYRTTELWGLFAGGSPLTLRLHPAASLRVSVSVPRELAESLTASAVILPADGAVLPDDAGVPADHVESVPHLEASGRAIGPAHFQDGRATIEVPEVPPGTLEIRVRAGSFFASRIVHAAEGETASVDIALPDSATGAIAGTVRFPADAGAQGGTVSLQDESLAALGGLAASLEPDGSFRLEGVPAGHHTLSLYAWRPVQDLDGKEATNIPRAPREYTGTIEVDVTAGATATVTIDATEVPMSQPLPLGEGGPLIVEPVPVPLFQPNLQLASSDAGLIVVDAPSGSGLLVGDRVLDVDGEGPAMSGIYGPQDSLCRVTAARMATGETIVASLPRAIAAPFSFERGEW